MSYSIKYQNGGVMNEHYKKGEEALALKDFKTAIDEFNLAICDPSPFIQKIAERRLKEIKDRKSSESKAGKNPQIKTTLDSSKFGYLSHLGYKVGNKGVSERKRHDTLRDAFYDQTILKEDRWGQAGSRSRFEKLCSELEFRVYSNRNKSDMTDAVNDWRKDLEWLESDFKKEALPEKSPE